MTYFTEIDLDGMNGGWVHAVEEGSTAASMGIQVGDELMAINDHILQDVIDVQFHGAEESLVFTVRRDGQLLTLEGQRAYGQTLGVEFTHPTFDTDIRRCNNLCEFCFVLQMAPRFRRTLYIKDDDYRYSFLFGHYVTLTNLGEQDWQRIEQMRLSPLYVSVHTTDLALRRQFLRNDKAPDILEQLKRLASKGIELHTQIVVVPGFNDGRWLEQSLDDLEQLWPAVQSVSVVPVGLTRHHKYKMRTHTIAECQDMVKHVHSKQRRIRQKLGVNFAYLTDEWYLEAGEEIPLLSEYDGLQLHENGLGMVRRFSDEWSDLRTEIADIRGSNGKPRGSSSWSKILLVTGTLFAPTLRRFANEFKKLTGIGTIVIPIKNQRLGETITAAGLLMVEDIISQIGQGVSGDLVVLPRVVFDHPDLISLDDRTPKYVADALGKPVALADSMGDVWDAVTGNSQLYFTQSAV